MKRQDHFSCILSMLTISVIIGAAVASFVVMLEKRKKENKELERYLDGAIQ